MEININNIANLVMTKLRVIDPHYKMVITS